MTLDRHAVLERIDADELVKLALELANFDSPTGEEGPVGEYVYEWLRREGFASTATWTPASTRTTGGAPSSS